MKKGFNASAKFPAVKEKSAAFTGSCLGGKLPRPNKALSHPKKLRTRAAKGPFFSGSAGGKLPRPSRAYPTVGRGPSCARAFRLQLFCHFPVRSRLRDMGPAQPNKALSHLEKPGARAAEGPFFSGSAAPSRLRDMPRRSRLHLLGVCGMINTAQALGPRKGRGGAPCRDRRGRYGT